MHTKQSHVYCFTFNHFLWNTKSGYTTHQTPLQIFKKFEEMLGISLFNTPMPFLKWIFFLLFFFLKPMVYHRWPVVTGFFHWTCARFTHKACDSTSFHVIAEQYLVVHRHTFFVLLQLVHMWVVSLCWLFRMLLLWKVMWQSLVTLQGKKVCPRFHHHPESGLKISTSMVSGE
jgi:hypothetical protein